MYWLRRERGQLVSETDPAVFRQIEGHAYFPIWRAGLALACCDAGDWAGAAAHVRALDEEYGGFAAFPPQGWSVPLAALLAETLAGLSPARWQRAEAEPFGGRLAEVAGRLRDLLAGHAGEFVLAGWPSVLLGPVERFSGLLALAAGDHDEALALFETAGRAVAGVAPQACRVQVNTGCALVRRAQAAPAGSGGRADRAEAARLLTEAAATAGRLGLAGLAAEAAGLLAEC